MAAVALVAAGAGCERLSDPGPATDAGAGEDPARAAADRAAADARAAQAAADARLVQGAPLVGGDREGARTAVRCSECHSPVFTDWLASDHARSSRSPMYLAMRRVTGPAACDPCHAPLTSLLEPGDPVIDQGVSCDVCHALKDVALDGPRTRLTFGFAEDIKWGTLCDGQEHYFHKTACSPIFQAGRLCAACHRWSISPAPGRTIPVLIEYDEWLASPAAAAGVTCQACHMPRAQAEVATGWKRTSGVGHHGMMGAAGELQRGAIGVTLSLEEREGALLAEVALKNDGTAHAAPAGLPGRQLVLQVATLDTAGRVLERTERTYARALVDAAGKEVPFYAAQAAGPDTRIKAGETRRESFSFRAEGAAALSAELLWRRSSPEIAAALGIALEERHLVEARAPLGPPTPGRARALPGKITAAPRRAPAP